MARETLDTIPLHALHTYSAALLALWHGLDITEEELASAREKRPLEHYFVIVDDDPGQVRVAEMKSSIAEARGKVSTHAPFARVATLRHDAATHDDWPGDASEIAVGDKLPSSMFDWTR